MEHCGCWAAPALWKAVDLGIGYFAKDEVSTSSRRRDRLLLSRRNRDSQQHGVLEPRDRSVDGMEEPRGTHKPNQYQMVPPTMKIACAYEWRRCAMRSASGAILVILKYIDIVNRTEEGNIDKSRETQLESWHHVMVWRG